MANHSPLPWRVEEWPHPQYASVHTPDGLEFGEIQTCDAEGTTYANAEFIVRAVNAHDELVAALKPFAAQVHEDGISAPYPWDEGEWPARFDAAKAALAKAEGK